MPPKENVAAAPVVVSSQSAPPRSVTSPLKEITRDVEVLEPKWMVPAMEVEPLTVKGRCTVRTASLLIDNDAHTNELLEPVDETGAPAAMITSSAAVGTLAGLQVAATDQTPPDPVLVLVAAVAADAPMHETANANQRIPAKPRMCFKKI